MTGRLPSGVYDFVAGDTGDEPGTSGNNPGSVGRNARGSSTSMSVEDTQGWENLASSQSANASLSVSRRMNFTRAEVSR